MMEYYGDDTNGYLERKQGGRYEGKITVEGVNLSPIVGQYFKKGEKTYLWLKRKRLLEYDTNTQTYNERERKPQWEAYLEKQLDGDMVAFKGEFVFLRFRFEIRGVWDKILGQEKQQRLNLYVERMPLAQQTIINGINERKSKE